MLSKNSVKRAELVAYHVLKSAIACFNQKPSELTRDQRLKVSETARKSYEMEHKILASKEAEDIVIPFQSIAQSIEELEGRYESSQDFLVDLKENGLSFDALQASIHRELWVEAVLDRVSAKVDHVDESEVITFYQNNMSKFRTEEKRKARHILITINDDYHENRLPIVKKRIESLLDELHKGTDFAKLASENSECPTALNGGEIGLIARGQLYREIDDQLFSLNEGDVSGPIKTEIGYHIVKCEKIEPAQQVSVFDAKEQIVAYLLDKKRIAAQRLWIKKLGQ